MAATTTDSSAVPGPLAPMHPTTIEHDFRFPRRPADAATGVRRTDRLESSSSTKSPPSTSASTAVPRTATSGPGAAGLRPGLLDGRLNLGLTQGGAAHFDLLRASAFPPFQQSARREAQSLEEMQREDPLATQIWKFYAKTKQLLPAQERMENLTWRMMHLKLQKTKAANATKYVFVPFFFHFFPLSPFPILVCRGLCGTSPVGGYGKSEREREKEKGRRKLGRAG